MVQSSFFDSANIKRKSHARSAFLPLSPVKTKPVSGDIERDFWLTKVCSSFVSPSKANKQYYKVVLELLWPPEHGIPGPYVTESNMREAIDTFRRANHDGSDPYKNYVDVFRRVRELQGEEGVVGIARSGRTYQLVDLMIAEKRIPRTKLNDLDWEKVINTYKRKCPVCNRKITDVQFQQDHKIPRLRGGGDQLDNWQPLCDECNNFKSTACRSCELDCNICPWAFPEKYTPLKISEKNNNKIRELAEIKGVDPNILLNTIIDNY